MSTTTSTYMQISNNLATRQAAEAKQPDVANATTYYQANIGSVTSVQDLIDNYRLFSYALTAYGLGDMVYAKGLVQKVLGGGVSDSTSLANTLPDPRYKAFAEAFDFAGKGVSSVTSAASVQAVTAAYAEQSLETDVGKDDPGVQLALYFQRQAPSITNPYQILGDPSLLTVFETTFGISTTFSLQSVDQQAATITNALDLSDLQDPTKVQKLLERFSAEYDLNNLSSSGSSVLSLFSDSSADNSSDGTDILPTLQAINGGGSSSSASSAASLFSSTSSDGSDGLSESLLQSLQGYTPV